MKDGYSDRSIFLPMTGSRLGSELSNDGFTGGFWTSSLHENLSDMAYFVSYIKDDIDVLNTIRPMGWLILNQSG